MSDDEVKANPNPGPGLAHDFHCTHNPCTCRLDDVERHEADIETLVEANAEMAAGLERLTAENDEIRNNGSQWYAGHLMDAWAKRDAALAELRKRVHVIVDEERDELRARLGESQAENERLRSGCVIECDDDCDAVCHMGHVVSWRRPVGKVNNEIVALRAALQALVARSPWKATNPPTFSQRRWVCTWCEVESDPTWEASNQAVHHESCAFGAAASALGREPGGNRG